MRQVQNEEMGFLLNTTNPDLRLAKIGLRMTRRMRQRHKYFLPTLLPLPNVILDDRVTAGEPAFLAEPVEYPLCRVPLFARHMAIRLKPRVDDRNERLKLRPPDLGRAPIARRHRKGHHLRNRIAGDVEFLRRLTLAHARRASLTHLQI